MSLAGLLLGRAAGIGLIGPIIWLILVLLAILSASYWQTIAAAILIWGVIGTSTGAAHPVIPPASLPPATEPVALWLILRALASGCTAMTGVETVGNGQNVAGRHGRALAP